MYVGGVECLEQQEFLLFFCGSLWHSHYIEQRDLHVAVHHHHHFDAKHLTKASHRCNCPTERSILRQLQGLGHCDTRVAADLVNPGGGWPTTGTSPFLRWPLTISRLGTDSKDLIGWSVCESLATWPNRPSRHLWTMRETSSRSVWWRTSSLETKSCQLMCKIRQWHRIWKESSLFQSVCVRVQISEP